MMFWVTLTAAQNLGVHYLVKLKCLILRLVMIVIGAILIFSLAIMTRYDPSILKNAIGELRFLDQDVGKPAIVLDIDITRCIVLDSVLIIENDISGIAQEGSRLLELNISPPDSSDISYSSVPLFAPITFANEVKLFVHLVTTGANVKLVG